MRRQQRGVTYAVGDGPGRLLHHWGVHLMDVDMVGAQDEEGA